MSHIVTIRTQVQNPLALRAACTRLGLAEPVQGTFELFAGQTASGLAVELPGWRCPIVCDAGAGALAYDNFSGHWGYRASWNDSTRPMQPRWSCSKRTARDTSLWSNAWMTARSSSSFKSPEVLDEDD